MALTNILVEIGIDKDRAETAKISEDRFYDAFGELESLLGGAEHGFEHALNVFTNGEVLNYNGTKLDEYLGLARKVAGKIGYQVDQRQIFYSVESLKTYLAGPQNEELDFSKLKFGRHRLLHNDPSSARYLNGLIEFGELVIGNYEYWADGNHMGSHRLRGASICNFLGRQINTIHDDLNLLRPRFVINHGQNKIVIAKETRELLEQIKEYKEQNL